MSRRRWTKVIASTVAAVLLVTGCGAGAGSGPAARSDGLIPVTVGVTPLLNAAPLYLGIQHGFFKDAGLAVEPKVIQAAATAIPSLMNGELQYALVSAVPAITAKSQGLPVAAVAGNDVYVSDPKDDGSVLLVAPNSRFQRTADLTGATIAIVGLRSMPELATRLALTKAGVDPASVKFVEIPYPEMLAGVRDGRVDAALFADPFLGQATSQGLRPVTYPYSTALPGVTGLLWIGVQPYLQQNADAAAKFTTAMTRAVEYAAAHPDEARASATGFTTLSPQALAAAHLPAYRSAVDEATFTRIAGAMVQQGFLKSVPSVEGMVWHR